MPGRRRGERWRSDTLASARLRRGTTWRTRSIPPLRAWGVMVNSLHAGSKKAGKRWLVGMEMEIETETRC